MAKKVEPLTSNQKERGKALLRQGKSWGVVSTKIGAKYEQMKSLRPDLAQIKQEAVQKARLVEGASKVHFLAENETLPGTTTFFSPIKGIIKRPLTKIEIAVRNFKKTGGKRKASPDSP